MNNLSNYIQEKLILNKDSKKQEPKKRASVDKVIEYLNNITDDNNPKVRWAQDTFYDKHWENIKIKTKHQKKIPDLIPANYFISQIFEPGEIAISPFYNKYFKDNTGVIDMCMIHTQANGEYIILVYDSRLDDKFKL